MNNSLEQRRMIEMNEKGVGMKGRKGERKGRGGTESGRERGRERGREGRRRGRGERLDRDRDTERQNIPIQNFFVMKLALFR